MNDQFEIGQLYDPARTVWPEGAKVTVKNGNIELILFFNRPSAAEVAAVSEGECEFGVMEIDTVIFFLFRFGGEVGWNEQTFNYHMIDQAERFHFELQRAQGARLFLNIKLVDASSGKIKALRSVVALTREFADEFSTLARRQLETAFSITGYDQQLSEIYANHPTARDFLKKCQVFSRKGF